MTVPQQAGAGAPAGGLDVPAGVVAAAIAAFDTRDAAAAHAPVVSDSLDDPGRDGGRTVVFDGGGLELRVLVTAGSAAGTARLVVEVGPDPLDRLLVHAVGQEPVDAALESPGRWVLQRPATGPVSLEAQRAGQPPLRTAWTRL